MDRENLALQDILAYEKQLLADREQLHNLLEHYQVDEDDIVRDKLRFFQNELKHMNHQYELLKKKTGVIQATDNSVDRQIPPTLAQTAQTIAPNNSSLHIYQGTQSEPTSHVYQGTQNEPVSHIYPKPQSNSASHVYPRPQTSSTHYDSPRSPYGQQSSSSTQKQFAGFEKMVGSSLMGILASGLIFISLILFATMIMPYLGQAFKMVACYLVSIVLIVVSLLKLQKDENNKFYLALAGCGVGALYITLLLTNIYFGYIGKIPLFVLITIWVGFVCYLSKSHNPIFHVIGQIGVTLSLIFGAILCVNTEDVSMYLSLIIFFVISFGTLYISHFSKELSLNNIGNSFGCCNLLILLVANTTLSESIFHLIFMVIVFIYLTTLFLQIWEKSQIGYGILVSLLGIMLAVSVYDLIGSELNKISGLIIYLIAMAVLFLTEFKPKGCKDGLIFAQIAMILQACIGLAFNEFAYKHGFVWLIILPLMLLGFFRTSDVGKCGTIMLTCFYLFQDIPDTERFILGLIIVIALYTLLGLRKKEASLGIKISIHLLGIVLLLFTGWDLLDNYIEKESLIVPIVFIVIAIYNVGMSKSPFSKNLLTGEKEPLAHYSILNVILMFVALIIIDEKTPLHIPVILVALVLFLQNSKNLLELHQNIWAGIYVGIKFNVLLYVILNSFDAVNYIVSSSFLLFSLASIVIGFVKEYKSLRVYGLILSMISVFKLVMLDIRYENTLGNALSFFISGVLCFVISMIYNYIDKKMINEKED